MDLSSGKLPRTDWLVNNCSGYLRTGNVPKRLRLRCTCAHHITQLRNFKLATEYWGIKWNLKNLFFLSFIFTNETTNHVTFRKRVMAHKTLPNENPGTVRRRTTWSPQATLQPFPYCLSRVVIEPESLTFQTNVVVFLTPSVSYPSCSLSYRASKSLAWHWSCYVKDSLQSAKAFNKNVPDMYCQVFPATVVSISFEYEQSRV